MSQPLKSVAIGIASGIATYYAATYALARTSAFVLPNGVPLAVWEIFVVFGLGVALVALVIHLAALTFARSRKSLALAGFVVAFLACLAASGLLQTGTQAVAAAAVGALLATGIARLRSNNSFKPEPLRGSA